MQGEIHITAVAFQEGETWVIQGIEYDIVAHASNLSKLPEAFMRAVVENARISEHLGREPLQGIRPAPGRFREMFEQATAELRSVTQPERLPDLPIAEMSIRLAEQA